jgi:hypothetical protein
MDFELSNLALGLVIVVAVWMAIRFVFALLRGGKERRADLTARRMAQQPWDAEGTSGRANR